MENGNGRTKKMRLGKNNARDRARRISQMPVDKKNRLEKEFHGFIQDFQFGGGDVVRGLTGMSEYFSHHAQKWC